jgi:FkbM family methyltransferase
VFRRVFADDDEVTLHQAAIGPAAATQTMHVSAREDSSSLLPISEAQTAMFPGTQEKAIAEVRVAKLDEFLRAEDLPAPALLKLDVQGYEYEALTGCSSLLHAFDWVYCESSFVELYTGQKLAGEVAAWLADRGFVPAGEFNLARDHRGQAVQGDFLFRRAEPSS